MMDFVIVIYRIVRLWSGAVSFFVSARDLVLSAGRWYPSLLRLACGQVREGTSVGSWILLYCCGRRNRPAARFVKSRLTVIYEG